MSNSVKHNQKLIFLSPLTNVYILSLLRSHGSTGRGVTKALYTVCFPETFIISVHAKKIKNKVWFHYCRSHCFVG